MRPGFCLCEIKEADQLCSNYDSRALTTIFWNGARAPGIGKISGVSVKIGKIVYKQTRPRTWVFLQRPYKKEWPNGTVQNLSGYE